jgi:hypothetical protein
MTDAQMRRTGAVFFAALDRARAGEVPTDDDRAAAELAHEPAQIMIAAFDYAQQHACRCADTHPPGWAVLARGELGAGENAR